MSDNPVTPADVAREIGADATDPRLIEATEAAWQLVEAYLDRVTDLPTPVPEAVTRATIGLAVDGFRAPGTAFGYFVSDVGIASTGMDALRRWRSYLDPWREQWGMA